MYREFDLKSFVEIKLKKPEDFLIVKETLSRIGMLSRNPDVKKLYQSCHILHKQGKYYLVHFKELFKLDGKETSFTVEDIARRNTIANALESWGIIDLVDSEKTKSPVVSMNKIVVVPFKEKDQYELIAKYTIGGKKEYKAN